MIKVFISHSSKDEELISKLINLFRDALSISPSEIRCTSIEGYRLPAGANTNDQLRCEVNDSQAFVSLISPSSLKSIYVVFELGARWGTGKHLIPLLAPGMNASSLEGPLASINALRCDNGAQLHQLVSDLARHLNIQTENPAVYQKHIDEILKLQINTSDPVSETSVKNKSEEFGRPVASFSASNDFAEAEKIIKQYCEKQWPDDFKMRLFCQDQQHSALAELKHGAPPDIPTDIFAKIRAKCASEWSDDYKMRLFCEQKQFDAYRKLKS